MVAIFCFGEVAETTIPPSQAERIPLYWQRQWVVGFGRSAAAATQNPTARIDAMVVERQAGGGRSGGKQLQLRRSCRQWRKWWIVFSGEGKYRRLAPAWSVGKWEVPTSRLPQLRPFSTPTRSSWGDLQRPEKWLFWFTHGTSKPPQPRRSQLGRSKIFI